MLDTFEEEFNGQEIIMENETIAIVIGIQIVHLKLPSNKFARI